MTSTEAMSMLLTQGPSMADLSPLYLFTVRCSFLYLTYYALKYNQLSKNTSY